MSDKKVRPILFSALTVRAILDGRKTQTRRIVKPMRDPDFGCQLASCEIAGEVNGGTCRIRCPYGQPGTRLWVRESFSFWRKNSDALYDEPDYEAAWYRADADDYGLLGNDEFGPVYADQLLWKPSIYMPRSASRITLEITKVRVERLNQISEADALAEGVRQPCAGKFKANESTAWQWELASLAYADLWESINGPGSWNINPWVWCISFRRID